MQTIKNREIQYTLTWSYHVLFTLHNAEGTLSFTPQGLQSPMEGEMKSTRPSQLGTESDICKERSLLNQKQCIL